MRPVRLALLTAVLVGCATLAPADDGFPKVGAKKPAGKAKSPAERAAACKAIGDLGEDGKGKRKELCEAMLDPQEIVRVAAMDAMKRVDMDMHKMCVEICIDSNVETVQKAGRQVGGAKPLIPLILNMANAAAPLASNTSASGSEGARAKLSECVQALVAIDSNNDAVNKAVLAMLANPAPALRTFALGQLPGLRDKAHALPTVMLFAADSPDQVAAIRMLPGLVDDKTRPAAVKLVESLRYHKTPAVRDAAAETLKKFE